MGGVCGTRKGIVSNYKIEVGIPRRRDSRETKADHFP
jgi:hypothetical protein